MSSTYAKCIRQSGRFSKTQGTESTDIKSSLRHTGKKNYMEQDDDNFSDYCPSPKKKLRTSTVNSERKLSLRSKDVSSKTNCSPPQVNLNSTAITESPSPKRNFASRNKDKNCSYNKSDRKLRNKTLNETNCCGGESEPSEIKNEPGHLSEVKMTRRSKSRRLTNSNFNNGSPHKLQSELKISPKLKSQSSTDISNDRSSKAKPKVIDHFNQSEEINIESSASNLPKKTNEHKKVHIESNSSRKRSTLSQKHTENNLPKLNGTGCVSHTNRSSISHHGKLCRKTKKTTIYHDSNGWILSKGYWNAGCEYWDWLHFDTNQNKNVKTQQEIEIPSFREKKYTPLYKIEGTEDLSDHVFQERHSPYEILEKKIKKNFVKQSIYELQKSKYLKNNELLYKKESFLVKKFPKFVELNPDASNLKKIEIVTEVPVMAFGVPVKKMEAEEFQNSLPGIVE